MNRIEQANLARWHYLEAMKHVDALRRLQGVDVDAERRAAEESVAAHIKRFHPGITLKVTHG